MSLLTVVKGSAVRSRHTVIYWFGNCAYTKLKVTYEVRAMLCPLCKHELVDGEYSGSKVFALAKYAVDYVRDSWLPLLEEGVPVWHVVEGGGRKLYKSFSS